MCSALYLLTCGLATLGSPGPVAAPWVVNNRTEHDLWVAVGKVEYGYTVDNIAGGRSNTVPTKIWAKGWWKVNRYGGSVEIPWGEYANGYLHVIGPGGRTLKVSPKGTLELPYSDKSFDFFVSLNDDKFATSGSLAKAAKDKGLTMRSFVPVNYFRQNNTLELTVEKLGWNNADNNPAPKKPGGGSDGSVLVPTKTISMTFTNETGQTVTFVLKGGSGPGTATGLAKGQTKTHSLVVEAGVTPVVIVTQPGGGSKSFTLQDKGNYAFRLEGGKIINYFK